MTIVNADRNQFIKAMRDVACSVTVVTTDGNAGRHGATVSAFNSLSADPPTVLVCLRSDSRISQMVTENGCFTVNVLPEECRDIARTFAGEFDADYPDRFEGLNLLELAGLAPGIESATIFTAKIVKAIDHGSHTVFIGEVAHVVSARKPPLTYHDGAYRGLHFTTPFATN
ncbi:flavin reductase family protein [Roseovarius pelagicus]|uniref:Flavin reductase family protein n=1 Tax=Roseovarius pelagicus TaxID=2980108 RepID=A0ABY6D5W4_9RHOB|nr:flavin reductase family protein [Roseovarius pelagicus]UXX81531.1 flavin reductase family protein [Roseovarius pelagicus]